MDAAYTLEKIDKDHSVAIAYLVELIRNSGDEDTRRQAADSLGAIDKDHPVAFSALVESLGTSQDNNNRRQAAESLEKICQDNPVAIVAVSGLKDCLTSQINQNDFNRYEICYKVIGDCAQNMTYPDFYQAWHTQPTNSPIPDRNHPQNTDIPTLLKQLQPTDKTFPVPVNIRALEGETDTSAIAQEFCTQLYQAIFPADTDIPAIGNAPEFKRLIPQLKNRLQKQHIALILHSCPCFDALSSLDRLPRRHSNGNSYRLDYRYTAGIALNRFWAKSRGLAECGTELDWRDWFARAGHPTVPIGDNLSRPSARPPVLSGVETHGAFSESPLAQD